jgi:hypothetical protein
VGIVNTNNTTTGAGNTTAAQEHIVADAVYVEFLHPTEGWYKFSKHGSVWGTHNTAFLHKWASRFMKGQPHVRAAYRLIDNNGVVHAEVAHAA